MNYTCNIIKNTKYAAMFGLDARIVLVILAVVSLSVSLVTEKSSIEQETIETKQQMEVLEAKFLKHWEKTRFAGYYTVPTSITRYLYKSNALEIPGFGKDDTVVKFFLGSSFASFDKPAYTRAKNSTDYIYQLSRVATNITFGGVNQRSFVVNNAKDSYFDLSPLKYFYNLKVDANYRLTKALNDIMKEDGQGTTTTINDKIFEDRFTGAEYSVDVDGELTSFSPNRFSLNRPVHIYFIVEYNVDDYSPSDYIVHVVMFTEGKNNKLETTMPMTLEDLDTFAGVQGDDIVHIFNTRDVYLRAKAENIRRLEEIKEKLLLIAESNYLDRVSLCATESTPSALCDLDSDGDFDTDDENLLVDYNPFPKSSLDTSGTNYYDATLAFDDSASNFNTSAGAQNFLSTTLSLPEYYAYDLFGNVLNYQSNVGLKTKGPYSMEVWY